MAVTFIKLDILHIMYTLRKKQEYQLFIDGSATHRFNHIDPKPLFLRLLTYGVLIPSAAGHYLPLLT